jgi:hypothetical protein
MDQLRSIQRFTILQHVHDARVFGEYGSAHGIPVSPALMRGVTPSEIPIENQLAWAEPTPEPRLLTCLRKAA